MRKLRSSFTVSARMRFSRRVWLRTSRRPLVKPMPRTSCRPVPTWRHRHRFRSSLGRHAARTCWRPRRRRVAQSRPHHPILGCSRGGSRTRHRRSQRRCRTDARDASNGPTSARTASQDSCPCTSFTSLNPSRSQYNTATCSEVRAPRSRQCPSRSTSTSADESGEPVVVRLGRLQLCDPTARRFVVAAQSIDQLCGRARRPADIQGSAPHSPASMPRPPSVL